MNFLCMGGGGGFMSHSKLNIKVTVISLAFDVQKHDFMQATSASMRKLTDPDV